MYPNLNAELARKDINQYNIAEVLNIHYTTVSDKMNGKKDFKLKECKQIKEKLLPEYTLDYLFASNSESIQELEESGE